MTRHEAAYAAGFLKELRQRQGLDGCNEMFLSDTPVNRELVIAATGVDEELHIHRGKLATFNNTIVHYLMKKIMEEHGLTEVDLPDTQN